MAAHERAGYTDTPGSQVENLRLKPVMVSKGVHICYLKRRGVATLACSLAYHCFDTASGKFFISLSVNSSL